MKTSHYITYSAISLAFAASILLLASGLSLRAQAGLMALVLTGTAIIFCIGFHIRRVARQTKGDTASTCTSAPSQAGDQLEIAAARQAVPAQQEQAPFPRKSPQDSRGQSPSPKETPQDSLDESAPHAVGDDLAVESVPASDGDPDFSVDAISVGSTGTKSGADPSEYLTIRSDVSPQGDVTEISIAPSSQEDMTLSLAEVAHAPLAPELPSPKHPFDFDAFSNQLVGTLDPAGELRLFVGDIRTREAEGPDSANYPSGIERFAARMLVEAGLLDRDESSDEPLPPFAYVRLRTSGMCYLRTELSSLPFSQRLRLLRVEAALNATLFCAMHATNTETLSLEDAFRLTQSVYQRFVMQEVSLDGLDKFERLALPDDTTTDDMSDGEWTVRRGISHVIETLMLPQRLTARFRTNVADGNVAFEIDLPPADVFPSSTYVEGLGVVATTGDMRQRAFADYALRLALLMASSAFRCSNRINHVWVAGIVDGPRRRTCYLSVDFDRWRFAKLDLRNLGDLDVVYRSFAPTMRHEADGWLRPVAQTFSLDEERFCPIRRYIPVSLSSRRLPHDLAERLGTNHVSGLAIEEADNRAAVAASVMLHMVDAEDAASTEHNVRTVIELAADDPDPTVRLAAERVVGKLIDGSLSEEPLAVGEEFINGDELTRTVMRAQKLMASQRIDEAARLLAGLLDRIDSGGCYADTTGIVYRYFSSYVERTLYNRLWAEQTAGRATLLVPNSYYAAHLLLSMCLLMMGRHQDALEHAQRTVEIAPLDVRARLNLVRCLEATDDTDAAESQLRELLNFSHEPEGLGVGYYRMAFFQWRRGNLLAAQACYRRAMQVNPMTIPMSAMELSVMSMQSPGSVREEMSEEEVASEMRDHDIPLAPTEQMARVFYDCTRAALDAEVFPVARNFVRDLGYLSQDDEIWGVMRSLEDEPDH